MNNVFKGARVPIKPEFSVVGPHNKIPWVAYIGGEDPHIMLVYALDKEEATKYITGWHKDATDIYLFPADRYHHLCHPVVINERIFTKSPLSP